MKISGSNTKMLLFNILNYEDGIDIQTKRPVAYTSYPKKYFKVIHEILDRLKGDVLVALYPETLQEEKIRIEDVTWSRLSPSESVPKGFKKGGERFSENEIDLGDSELAKEALLYFYKLRQELPRVPVDAVMELEEVLK